MSRRTAPLHGGGSALQPGRGRTLAIAGQFDHQFTVPVRNDDGGGTVMMMPSPAPAVEDTELAGSAGLRWHVDLELLGSAMPRGRGLDGQALFAPGENSYLTNVRSGRDGITFGAGRLDFVAAGTAPLSRLARPRLRKPDSPSGRGSSPGSRDWPSGCPPRGGERKRSGTCGTAEPTSSAP